MDQKDFIPYNTTTNNYFKSAVVDVMKNCNGFTFTNVGGKIARVNGMIIYPGVPGTSLGDSRSVGGNEGEIYKGRIQIAFEAGGANPNIEIVQKFYPDNL